MKMIANFKPSALKTKWCNLFKRRKRKNKKFYNKEMNGIPFLFQYIFICLKPFVILALRYSCLLNKLLIEFTYNKLDGWDSSPDDAIDSLFSLEISGYRNCDLFKTEQFCGVGFICSVMKVIIEMCESNLRCFGHFAKNCRPTNCIWGSVLKPPNRITSTNHTKNVSPFYFVGSKQT